jgi:Tfp pilus assembly protein PilF
MKTSRWLLVAGALAVPIGVACSGPSKPPQGPGASSSGSPDAPGTGPASSDTAAAPSSPEVQRGINALNDGQLPTARSLFEIAVQKNPNDADATYYLGLANYQMGDKAAAENFYKAALKLRPDLENAAVNLAALYIDAKRYDDAVKVSKDALDKRPDSAAIHFNLAVALSEKKDQAGASSEYEEAVRRGPDEAMYHYTYGHWLGAWGKPDLALVQLRAALLHVKETQDNVGLLAGIGHDFLLLRQTSDCIGAFDKAITLKDAAPLRTERALCKLAAKDEPGAEADFRAAIAADAAFALPHYWLGVRLEKVKKNKEALAEFQTYAKLDPSGPMAQKAQEHITALKKAK